MIAVLPAELFYSTSRETKSSSYFWGLRLKKGILEWHLFYSYSRDTDFKNTNFKLPQKLWDLLIFFLEWRTGKQVFNSTMRNLLQLCIKLVLEGSFQKRLWKWAHWNYYKTEGFRQEKNLILYSALNLLHCSEYFHVLSGPSILSGPRSLSGTRLKQRWKIFEEVSKTLKRKIVLQHLIYWVFKLRICVMEWKSKFYVEVGKMQLYLLIRSKKKKKKKKACIFASTCIFQVPWPLH